MSKRRLRQQPRHNYYELDEPSFDEYVYCDKCGDHVYEYCSIHGALLVIPDDKVPSKSRFSPSVPRAALTIPHVFLHIKPSSIPGAGLGVFATLALPSGVRFGPYQGLRTKTIKSVYCWQIYDDDEPSHVVDGFDDQVANWLRYVNCARHSFEQNLVAYQYQGEIYYRTIKTITRFSELLVFYGSQFAHSLNVDLGKYNSKKHYLQAIGMPPGIDADTNQRHCSEEVTSTTIEISRDTYIHDNTPVENIGDNAVDVIEDDFEYINDDFMITEDKTRDNDAISNADKEFDDTKPYNDIETEAEERVINNANNAKASGISIGKSKADFRNQPLDNLNLKAEYEFEFSRSNVKNVIDSQMILDGKYLDCFIKIASDDKGAWQCKSCRKTIIDKRSLKYHALIHADIKLYKCLQCEYKSNRPRDMVKHMVKHTGKYIKCEFCVFTTNSTGNLRRHVKLIHVKGQPKCELCDYQVNQIVLMQFHRKLHELKDAIKCDFCDYLCLKKKNLNSHVRAVHEKTQ